MADKKEVQVPSERVNVVARSITTEMREAYLDYAMSVITSRALPDVRDGLKPVHRRILYTLYELGLTAGAKTRKSAKIVGDVTGNYHPHGTVAVYESLVKLIQDFSMRYPLAIGQGNFGNIDGDGAAADRYTEAKMSKIAAEMLKDIDKETVAFRPNYEGTREEPSVLPAAVPNLLLNGTLGIAVGMATNVPPNNLTEVVNATIHLIDNEEATTEDLMEFIQGPDFPTGGIIYNKQDILQAYSTGRGGIVNRGEAEIVEDKKGQFAIVITSIPYRVNRAELILKIADLVRDKQIEGIRGIRDESTKDTRIVIELKNTAHPQKVLNYLYKHTQLEETFHVNLVVLVDGVPQTISVKGVLEEFIKHRVVVVRKRTEFDLNKAKDREHILLGLKKALDHIDRIIKLIRASKDVGDAHKQLMKEFSFSDKQATAILEMRLQKLAGLERKKIEEELAEVQSLIERLETLLGSAKKILGVIKDELKAVLASYQDERRTKVVKHGVKAMSDEDLIPDVPSVLVYTAGGYIKRTAPEEYKKQKRGGVGVVDLETKEEDFITHLVTGTTHSDLLFFTDKGKVYQIKMYDIPEGKRATKGKSIVNFISLSEGENVTSILVVPKETKNAKLSLFMTTKEGVVKKVAAASFHDVRRSGIIAISLHDKDLLMAASFVSASDTVMLVTKDGQSIRFDESDVREMGRAAAGVTGIKLAKGDHIVSAVVVPKDVKDAALLVMSEKGYGKRTDVGEYKIQNRAGSGIITMNVTDKTGNIMSATLITEEGEELVVISKQSQVIRTGVSEIPVLGRSTQGVRVMRLRDGDSIASMICL